MLVFCHVTYLLGSTNQIAIAATTARWQKQLPMVGLYTPGAGAFVTSQIVPSWLL
jgi:hypothetical protein